VKYRRCRESTDVREAQLIDRGMLADYAIIVKAQVKNAE